MPSSENEVSRLPLMLYRTSAKSSSLPLLAYPATTILSSACMATPCAVASSDPTWVMTMPSSENEVSRLPLMLYRTTATCQSPSNQTLPATTILPSLCSATALARSLSPPIAVVTMPSLEKEESSQPLLRYRATANTWSLSLSVAYPATTILPSGCMATALASSFLFHPKSLVTVPPRNELSRLPSSLYRTNAKS